MDRKKIAIVFISLLIVFVSTLVIFFVKDEYKKEEVTIINESNLKEHSVSGKWNEGIVSYKGKKYKYNFAMETYLCLGIDKDGVVDAVENGIDGGQSDAIFLIAIDNNKKDISVIGINRNTMTEVDVYDINGSFLETKELQICLQHGYGDGAELSCARSVKAVQKLFYDIPITGYFSLNMGGIPILNDAVGGVTLCALEDISNESKGVFLKKGESVTLTGDEAYMYVRHRDVTVFDSASMRLERQMQYILSLFTQIKTYMGGDVSKATQVLESGEEYICTNVAFDELADKMLQYSFDEANMYSVAGNTVKGDRFEEYHVNTIALQKLIFDIFYEEVE